LHGWITSHRGTWCSFAFFWSLFDPSSSPFWLKQACDQASLTKRGDWDDDLAISAMFGFGGPKRRGVGAPGRNRGGASDVIRTEGSCGDQTSASWKISLFRNFSWEHGILVGGFKHFLFSISYMGCHPSH